MLNIVAGVILLVVAVASASIVVICWPRKAGEVPRSKARYFDMDGHLADLTDIDEEVS